MESLKEVNNMKFTYIELDKKIPYEMDMSDVITQFELEGFSNSKLNDVINSVKNWKDVRVNNSYVIYRVE